MMPECDMMRRRALTIGWIMEEEDVVKSKAWVKSKAEHVHNSLSGMTVFK
jgi:hypothetical protein